MLLGRDGLLPYFFVQRLRALLAFIGVAQVIVEMETYPKVGKRPAVAVGGEPSGLPPPPHEGDGPAYIPLGSLVLAVWAPCRASAR